MGRHRPHEEHVMDHRRSPVAVGSPIVAAIALIIASVAQGADVPAAIGGITYTGGT
jgi:hypothetical protein